jgi:hypothetical protein
MKDSFWSLQSCTHFEINRQIKAIETDDIDYKHTLKEIIALNEYF